MPSKKAAPSDLLPLLGSHVPTIGGVAAAIDRGVGIGCTAMQIFVKNNMQWFAKPLPVADAKAYARWLSTKTGRDWRLPTEAEWEYAARAGTTTRRPWGESADAGCAYANFSDQTLKRALGTEPAANCADGFVHTAPVGSLLPNAWGLHDMLGNAWEWTEDCWHEGYAGAPDDGSARSDPGCVRRVNRGAGWNSNPRNVRSSNRGNYAGVYRYNIIGFRVVLADAAPNKIAVEPD